MYFLQLIKNIYYNITSVNDIKFLLAPNWKGFNDIYKSMKDAKPTPLLDKDEFWKGVTEKVKDNYELP